MQTPLARIRYNESSWKPEMTNCRDGPETEKILLALSMAEARKQFPGQGALPKFGGDFRIIHDGTHGGVQVNNDIVIQDGISISA